MTKVPFLIAWLALVAHAQNDWRYVGGDAEGTRYSTLQQINTRNVRNLRVAWTFHTGPHQLDKPSNPPSIQCTPLVIDGVMYLTSADTKVFAINPATGRELWRSTQNAPGSDTCPIAVLRIGPTIRKMGRDAFFSRLRMAGCFP